jgi:hypothetical protein
MKREQEAIEIMSLLRTGQRLTRDYPGGVKKAISFHTHDEIDLGLAAMAATMPEFLAFKDDNEKKLFCARGDDHGCARADSIP